MERILVSACLLGRPVRWDGGHRLSGSAHLARWRDEGRLVVICPELSAGMAVPRPPAEIAEAAGGGEAVLDGQAKVIERGGADVSAAFIAGAEDALRAAREAGCRHALLTEGSPSCGSHVIHAGRFDGSRRAGRGVTVALLERNGVRVWAETEIDALARHLGWEDGNAAPSHAADGR